MSDKIENDGLRFAYDLPLAKAKEWGLYISTSRGKTSIGIEEPDLFSEPGHFMVTPQHTPYYGSVDFAIANDYPARGEYVETV